jgi:hypothetical protein
MVHLYLLIVLRLTMLQYDWKLDHNVVVQPESDHLTGRFWGGTEVGLFFGTASMLDAQVQYVRKMLRCCSYSKNLSTI